MKIFNFKIIILALCIFGASHTAYASTLSVNTNKTDVKTGGLFTANVMLDSTNVPINTIEGDLVYDHSMLTPERINIGDSFISFWVEKPSIKNTGSIHFSGIVPGGLTATNSEVFSVVFRAKVAGNTSITISNAALFINDGQGTKDEAIIKNKSIRIVAGVAGVNEVLDSTDSIAPEIFKITRTKDLAIFDNKYFVVFSTQDKESGVDHYTVCEYTKRNCEISESPYLLKYQNPFYRIIVIAYDGDGNAQEVILTSQWLILIIICLLLLIIKLGYSIHHRYLKKNKV